MIGVEEPVLPPFIVLAVLVYALALLFLLPSREVTQPPGRKLIVWETLFPGTSPQWSFLGALVLVAWAYFLVQVLLLQWTGTPRLVSFSATPSPRAYGVPGDSSDILRFINPSWVWVYLAPAALFAVNLVMVWRSRRSQ